MISPIIQAPQLEEHSLSMSILLMNKSLLEGKYLMIDSALWPSKHVQVLSINSTCFYHCNRWQRQLTNKASTSRKNLFICTEFEKSPKDFPKSGSWQESRNTAAHSCNLLSLLNGSFHIPLGYWALLVTGPIIATVLLAGFATPKAIVWSNKLRWLMVYVVTTLQDSGSAALRNN